MRLDAMFQSTDKAIDPVCKMHVDIKNPPGGTAEHEGKTYYFCMAGCRRTFVADPTKFVPAAPAS